MALSKQAFACQLLDRADPDCARAETLFDDAAKDFNTSLQVFFPYAPCLPCFLLAGHCAPVLVLLKAWL